MVMVIRVGRNSELPSVITAITRPYCNYGNYDTVLLLHALDANVTVITVITSPYCKYDTYEPPDPDGYWLLVMVTTLTLCKFDRFLA